MSINSAVKTRAAKTSVPSSTKVTDVYVAQRHPPVDPTSDKDTLGGLLRASSLGTRLRNAVAHYPELFDWSVADVAAKREEFLTHITACPKIGRGTIAEIFAIVDAFLAPGKKAEKAPFADAAPTAAKVLVTGVVVKAPKALDAPKAAKKTAAAVVKAAKVPAAAPKAKKVQAAVVADAPKEPAAVASVPTETPAAVADAPKEPAAVASVPTFSQAPVAAASTLKVQASWLHYFSSTLEATMAFLIKSFRYPSARKV